MTLGYLTTLFSFTVYIASNSGMVAYDGNDVDGMS